MAFGQFKIIAGDFVNGSGHQFTSKTFLLRRSDKFLRETIQLDQISSIEVASEESVKRLGGTLGWGAAGAVLLGPVGLLAGLLAGGRSKDVTFICVLNDDRKFMATAPAKVYNEIQAAMFDHIPISNQGA